MPGDERPHYQSIEALEAEVSQMHHFILEVEQSGGHDGSITSNASEVLDEIKNIKRHYQVYDTMVNELPPASKLKLLNTIKNSINEFLKRYHLTLSTPRPDYDVVSDAAASISDSEQAAQDLELDRYEEIDQLINEHRALRSQLLSATLDGKLTTSETTTALLLVGKINALKNNDRGLSPKERILELKLLKTEVQQFIDDLRSSMKMPVIPTVEKQIQIFEAEQTFYSNFLIVVTKMRELKIKLDSYSDIERLTQSNKIESIQLLYTQLIDCHDQVQEYFRIKSTLRLEKILEYIEKIRVVVDDAIEAIQNN